MTKQFKEGALKWNSRALHFCLFWGGVFSLLRGCDRLSDASYVSLMPYVLIGYLLTNLGKTTIHKVIDVIPSTRFGAKHDSTPG